MISAPSITRRAVTAEDLPLLRRIYASTRTEELAPVPWTREQKEEFLAMQFRAQHSHYQSSCPDAVFEVIEQDGEPAGRLYVDRRPGEIRVIDISLLPAYRGNGIGSLLLNGLIDESETTGRPLTIHVEQHNRALRLYQRLGFTVIGETGVYFLMHRGVSRISSHP